MSKAFTRESDDLPDPSPVARPFSVPGGKNYLTAAGAKRLEDELGGLLEKQQNTAGAKTEEAKRELQILHQRISYLQQSLAAAVISPPPARPWEQVFFGATVTVCTPSGDKTQYRIVGVDETDLDKNWVSWTSPVARGLLKARLGQKIHFRDEQWEIVGITYE